MICEEQNVRKIIHIDMDCFYAAIEIRDNPTLKNKPVAVGGSATKRGVLCTCNYLAREYGLHSAMPTATALRLCPDLEILPVNMNKYREVSAAINHIFHQFTDLVEPLSLDEAFLDVTGIALYQGSATHMAKAIQQAILKEQSLTASAGVATNKFLAKIASAWHKPNGLFVVTPAKTKAFVTALPISKLFGVGKVTAQKLHQLNIFTCADLHQYPLNFLTKHFGKFGQQLYYQARGIDNRPVQPNRIRKSLSVETTFPYDITDSSKAIAEIDRLYNSLLTRINAHADELAIKNQFIKIKNNQFKLYSAERKSHALNKSDFFALFQKMYSSHPEPIRLIGLGVHFQHKSLEERYYQHSLFSEEDY